MWQCSQCGREFNHQNQSHFCGQKPSTIEEYILSQAEDKQADLWKMKCILNEALPEAEERISWSMPTFWYQRNICHFAAFKHHIGFYPGSKAIVEFQKELTSYKTSKGTIQIPYGKIDETLIKHIAQWCDSKIINK